VSPDKLVYMANQIGKFFVSQGRDKAAAGIAEHIAKFWDPRMRATILAHLKAGGAGLDPAGATRGIADHVAGRGRPYDEARIGQRRI
jgi:formate dehydrogenase subunit delta